LKITNCSNNYGPYQFPEKLIPLMILNARQGAALPVYGDGQQVRDWLYVEDHCRAVWQVILKGERGETYNIGGKNQPTNLSIVKEICAILDEKRPDSPHIPHEKLISHVKDRPGHDRRYAMEIHKITSSIGWTPSVSLREGLEKTISWYLENPGWVETVTEKKEYSAWVKENYQNREQS
jgi:dTDP-glucose 4,6-dehydratase